MRNSIIIFLALAAMGCSTQKRCFKLYPPVESVTVEYRDTTIFIQLPGDTIYGEVALDSTRMEPVDSVVLLPAPSPIIETEVRVSSPVAPDTATARGSYSEAKAWYEGGKILLRLVEFEQSIPVNLDSAVVNTNKVEVHTPPPVVKIPWYYKASLPVAVVLLLLWIVFIIFVVLRR